MIATETTVCLTVNGARHTRTVPVRLLLSDFLRAHLGLTGTHVGCEHGVCGCCTVLLDGEPVRACLIFAPQVDGHEVTTVEGLAPNGALHPLQEAFREEHALQCGFCTPGFLITLVPFLERNPDPSPMQIREAISGNLCRCTGYQNIVKAVQRAAAGPDIAQSSTPPDSNITRNSTSPNEIVTGNSTPPSESLARGSTRPDESVARGSTPRHAP